MMRDGDESASEDTNRLVALIDELQSATSDAAAQNFPRIARKLDECRFALAREAVSNSQQLGVLMDKARGYLEMWRAVREW